MKFRIRFADQIVGLFIIAALTSVVFVIFLIGSRQRWFAKDYIYKTYFDSAVGLSANMAVQYKGFAIGNVQSFDLTADDRVEVLFSIYDTYNDRVTEGSLVEVMVSPIGLGNQFHFYPGLGVSPLEEGGLIPSAHSPEGRRYIQSGLARITTQDDSITLFISRANTLLEEINAAIAGTGETSLGRTIGGMEETVAGAKNLVQDLNSNLLRDLNRSLPAILAETEQVIADLKVVSAELANPDSLVLTTLDTGGPVFTNLEASLKAAAGTLQNLEKTAAFLSGEAPQLAGLIAEVQELLGTGEDVLIALRNNPLLRRGVPDRGRTQSGGTNPRNIEF
ncbi:MAG: MlaD family protein [Spirochaetaceae bacterium]|jgi:phospholipid/cholesterol/gamma-HCH transport system substrate-binding protein|nr:MlaD family protein [Spirochaetaceae bacterium]